MEVKAAQSVSRPRPPPGVGVVLYTTTMIMYTYGWTRLLCRKVSGLCGCDSGLVLEAEDVFLS